MQSKLFDIRSKIGIYLLPNILTTLTLFSGFYSIIHAINHHLNGAIYGIIAALFFDGIDGRVARLTNTQSEFGKCYDSLADLIAFGLAPPLAIYLFILSQSITYGTAVSFCFLAATALRLARFSIQDDQTKDHFIGLPCPAAAGVLTSYLWLFNDYDSVGTMTAVCFVVMVLMLSGLMVSSILYPSYKMGGFTQAHSMLVAIVIILITISLFINPPLVISAQLTFYTVFYLIKYCLRKKGGS